ncbi:Swarming motility regulation sensor protein RssA [compost metagenome]
MVPLAVSKHIDLGLVEADAGRVHGHAEPLRELLINLVDNALKYTPEGGTVDVSVRREAGQQVLAVEDSGPGISEADRARVLDRFYRVPGSTTTGSGLGLAIASAIAQLHGATLELDRSPRLGGLRIGLRLPLRTG